MSRATEAEKDLRRTKASVFSEHFSRYLLRETVQQLSNTLRDLHSFIKGLNHLYDYRQKALTVGRPMRGQVDYARTALDLIDEFDRLDTPDAVMRGLSHTLSQFGFSAFLVTGVPEPPLRLEPYMLLNGWPKGWTEHYVRESYYIHDPVAAYCRRMVNPFDWSDAPINREINPKASEVMRVAEDFGMRQGFLVPVVQVDGFHACVTMAGERPDFEPRAKRAIHLISIYAHARICALKGGHDAAEKNNLTETEREILKWLARGKSSWEISVILRMNARTVDYHVGVASRKLNAVNRVQAVAQAILTRGIRP